MLAALLLPVLLPQTPPPVDLGAELSRLVDAPPASRAALANQLAARNLGTLDTWLAACRAFGTFAALPAGATRHTVSLPLPDGAATVDLHLYVPPGYDPAVPQPLLLWGHGAGGTGEGQHLVWQAVADQLHLLVLAPTALGEAGYSFSARERELALQALRWVRRQCNVDENAVFVGGWSQGGHAAWDLALRQPQWFAGAAVVVGGPRMQLGEQNNLRFLENVVDLPICDLQGSKDDPRLLQNLHLARQRLQQLGAKDFVLHEFPDRGHDADFGAADWLGFFARRRAAWPARSVRLCVTPAESRSAHGAVVAVEPKVRVDVPLQVDPATWSKLDEAGQRAFLLDRLVDHTARLVVTDQGQGRFLVESRGVRSFALHLPREALGKDGQVEVRWQGKVVRKKAVPTVAVLLRDFAERFDRTRLPVATVVVP